MVTARQIWHAATRRLEEAGVEDAAFDAAQLVCFAGGVDARSEAAFPAQRQAVLDELLARRCAREPLQYLLGEWDFLDLTLSVGPGVLIPRPDTERTAMAAIDAARGFPAPRVADLCSGGGAIALGVALHVPGAQVTAVELSKEAMPYLRENNRRYGFPLRLVQADVLEWQNQLADASLEVLVSNPPYISARERETLAPVLDFEPSMALVAEEEGLAFYRHIAPAYFSKLTSGGVLVLEIGWQQGKQVAELCRAAGYVEIIVLQDWAGNDRCVCAKHP